MKSHSGVLGRCKFVGTLFNPGLQAWGRGESEQCGCMGRRSGWRGKLGRREIWRRAGCDAGCPWAEQESQGPLGTGLCALRAQAKGSPGERGAEGISEEP